MVSEAAKGLGTPGSIEVPPSSEEPFDSAMEPERGRSPVSSTGGGGWKVGLLASRCTVGVCPHDAVADGPTWTQPSPQRASGHQQMTHSGVAKMNMAVASTSEVHHLRGFCGRVLRP
jgi:hypothetical protein